MYHLGVDGASDAYEGAELCADGSLHGGEHGVGMFVIHRDGMIGEDR